MFKIGYYTYYNLSVRNNIDMESQKAAAIRLNEIIGFGPDITTRAMFDRYPFGFISDDEMKWYEWESDMLTLSSEFPEIEFVLYGEGEERDDNWRAFFKNGECVYQQAHMYYDPEPVFKE